MAKPELETQLGKVKDQHLRGQVIFRDFVKTHPDFLTDRDKGLFYSPMQADYALSILGHIMANPTAVHEDGRVYRPPHSSQSGEAVTISSPQCCVYDLVVSGVSAAHLSMQLARHVIDEPEYKRRKQKSTPFGEVAAAIDPSIVRLCAVDPVLLLGNSERSRSSKFVELTHLSTAPALRERSNWWASNVLYKLGRATLYDIPEGQENGASGLDLTFFLSHPRGREVIERWKWLASVSDQYGGLTVFGRVANVPQRSK